MKRCGVFFAILFFWNLLMGICGNVSSLSAEEVRVFFGAYDREAASRGIYAATLDERSETLSEPTRAADVPNPGFLVFSQDHQFLYAVCGEAKDSVAVFRVEAGLTELNRLTGLGKSVCHLALDPSGQNLLTAHYSSSDFALFALKADHSLDRETQRQALEGKGPNASRQSCPHPHSVKFGVGDCFYVPDLGTDRIMIYQLDAARHAFAPNDPPFAAAEPGSGPRHLCFLPDKKTAYSANELSSTVTAWHVRKNGALEAFETLSTLPADWKSETVNSTAEVACTPDGRFLYVSNRGHDSLACFKVAPDGSLTLREIVSVHGKTPRHFAISPTGRHLLTANQDSDSVSLFAIHPDSGKLEFRSEITLPVSPVCVAFDLMSPSKDAEKELSALRDLKATPSSVAWSAREDYPWTATQKSLPEMNPKDFPDELILARMTVEKLDQLQSFITLGFAMEALSRDDENRDFIREMTSKAVLQHAELLVSRFSSLNFSELRIVRAIADSVLENLKKIQPWNASDPLLNLCYGWMLHYVKTAELKDGTDASLTIITNEDAQKAIHTGIEQAIKMETGFENVELLADSLMARAIWLAEKDSDQSLRDMELASTLNPQMKEQVRDSKLLLFLHTKQFESAMKLIDQRIKELESQALAPDSPNAETSPASDPSSDAEPNAAPEAVEVTENPAMKNSSLLLKLKSLRLEVLAEMQKWSEIVTSADEILKTIPEKTPILLSKFQALIQLQKYEEALEVLNLLIDENTLNAHLYQLRGQVLLVLEKPEKALEDFSQALSIGGDSAEIWELKLGTLIQLNRLEDAQNEVAERLKKEPDDIPLLIQSAALFVQQKKYPTALEQGRKAEAALEKMLKSGAKPDADESSDEEKITESQMVVYQFLANYCLMAGKHAEAVNYYEKFLKVDGENHLILNNFAWVLATSPDDDVRNGKKALELAQKAVKIFPSPGYRSTLAAAYAELGNFEEALKTINQALEEAGDDAELTESLKKEKESYDAKKPIRERTETYK